MKLIGISGKMGTGKTTLAKMLLERLPGRLKRVAFADLLKQEVSEKYGIPLEWCYSEEGKSKTVDNGTWEQWTVRELLQWYGTEFRRAEDPDYWVKAMLHELDMLEIHNGYDGVIIDDVRFPNEADLVKNNDGYLIRIAPYVGWDKPSDHASETALDSYTGWSAILCPEYCGLSLVADWVVDGYVKLNEPMRRAS